MREWEPGVERGCLHERDRIPPGRADPGDSTVGGVPLTGGQQAFGLLGESVRIQTAGGVQARQLVHPEAWRGRRRPMPHRGAVEKHVEIPQGRLVRAEQETGITLPDHLHTIPIVPSARI